ncbi:MAG: NAD(P)-dependent oxidoreductase [Verrucomicrobia bacterium]|nr:NAD(P)-dependent oxidoreductase [Verrucomicrobiota bacterium]
MSRDSSRGLPFRRVLILGHTGFIGGCIERRLRDEFPDLELTGGALPDLDLTRDAEAERLADRFDLETAVIVCAAIKRQLGDTLETLSQNLKIASNLGRALQAHPVARLIYFSSAAVYGEENHNTNITEETPARPTSFYGVGKLACEGILQKVIGQQPKSSLVILRPALVYGPGDRSASYGPSGFVRAALSANAVKLWGNGEEMREFVFVEDVARLVRDLVLSKWAGVLNVVSGRSYSFVDVLNVIERLTGKKIHTTSAPRTKPQVDHGFNNVAVKNLQPHFAFTSLEEGVRQMLAADSRIGGSVTARAA